MKNFTLKALFLIFALCFSAINAQEKNNGATKLFNQDLTFENQSILEETGFIRCVSTEYERSLQEKYPNRYSNEEFENWIAPKIQEIKAQRLASPNDTDVVVTIPVVVHVIHSGQFVGVAPNITDAQVISQITVMTEDFRRMLGTPGYNTHVDGADVEIEFCLAQQDPNGVPTNGINRVNLGQADWSTADVNGTVKPATQWDPTKYLNMWSVDFTDDTLLGYAQFPSDSGLSGLNTSGGAANTDGVVAVYSTFGSMDYNDGSFLLNAPYDRGRTMTHEVGHWLGLRHIWGDTTTCTDDDYCPDTPDATTSNGGCPTIDHCTADGLGNDMVENYMDYTDDTCMNIFTNDQKARVLAVMTNSPRRMELPTSIGCTPATTPIINFGSTSPGQIMEGSDCSFQDFNIDLTISLGASASATANLIHSGTATENLDFELLTNSVTFNSGSTTASNSITLRVYEDGIIETDETISLSINVTTTGDAIAHTNTFDLIIGNDDAEVLPPTSGYPLFSDDFESYSDFIITGIGDWITLDLDGLNTYTGGADAPAWDNAGAAMAYQIFNPTTAMVTNDATGTSGEVRNFDPHSGSKYAAAWAGVPAFPITANDDWLVSPAISLTDSGSSVTFWVKSMSNSYGLEVYNVGVYVGSGAPSSGSDFTLISTGVQTAPYPDWGEITYDLSAYNGQDIRIGIQCVSADTYMFMVEDFEVIGDISTDIQTVVNTSNADQFNFTSAGVTFSTDPTSGNLMLDIDNTGDFNYGCTTVSVSRDAATAGADAVMYNSPVVSDYVFAKTFDIATLNTNTSDDTTINFYFTEAEVSAWETITGNSRTSLYVKKEGTDEIIAGTIATFGADVKVSASFTTGLTGTYVFGVQNSLSVDDFELNNSISIYPNPVTNRLTIKLSNDSLPHGYKIYNILGQIISENSISNLSDLEINTSSLSNGMYFIKVSKDNNATTLQFIKN